MAIKISYYSDILCIWAYIAQARVDAVKRDFGGSVDLDFRFCSVFGDAQTKLADAWRGRDGLAGYNRHVLSIAERFPHARVNPDVWLATQPASSMSPHLFLKAVMEWERTDSDDGQEVVDLPVFERVTWALRRGFFQECRDICRREVQWELASPFKIDAVAIEELINDGTAFASLSADYQHAEEARIEGSPTFVLNEGRQKFYGNVGFRVIDANVRELLRDPESDQASWC
ncbi:MAG: hypothetical protein J0I45_18025 [Bosea sp.]|jgi:predicted DsbA family dithiol-disulfide isomerase|nr:hypothetical protein [Bosea sp. (in: a-proteobacteria)]